MINIIRALREGTEPEYPSFYSYADNEDGVKNAYHELIKYVQNAFNNFEYDQRLSLSALPSINITSPVKVINVPSFIMSFNPLNLHICELYDHCQLMEDDKEAYSKFETGLIEAICKNKTYDNIRENMLCDVCDPIWISPKDTNKYSAIINCGISHLSDDLGELVNHIKNNTHSTDISYYKRATIFFDLAARQFQFLIATFLEASNMLYYQCNPTNIYDANETKLAQLKNDTKCYMDKIDQCKKLQDRLQTITKSDNPNSELNKKINILNEKINSRKKEIDSITEAIENSSKEQVSTYISNLNSMIEEIRKTYETFEYKEVLKPRKKTVDKMEEYVKGAIDRKYPLRIPMYTVYGLSSNAKKIVSEKFIPLVEKIVKKYPEYLIIAPKFAGSDDESEDIYIYITLKEPFGDEKDAAERKKETINEAVSTPTRPFEKSMYDIRREGRFYIVVSPDGRNLGNHDSLEDANDGIREDIREYNAKCAQNESGFGDPDYANINRKIDSLQRMIDANERQQSRYEASHGESSTELYNQHDKLCDQMDNLLAQRHKIAKKSINEATISSEERSKLDDSDFGVPEIKGYPLIDEAHIRKAIQFYPYCKVNYKDELAKNIAKKIIELKLVGKITISQKNKFSNRFPVWMQDIYKPELVTDKDAYKILIDGKEVDHGTIPEKKVSSISESIVINPKTGELYI